jgi:hypothetical protein
MITPGGVTGTISVGASHPLSVTPTNPPKIPLNHTLMEITPLCTLGAPT